MGCAGDGSWAVRRDDVLIAQAVTGAGVGARARRDRGPRTPRRQVGRAPARAVIAMPSVIVRHPFRLKTPMLESPRASMRNTPNPATVFGMMPLMTKQRPVASSPRSYGLRRPARRRPHARPRPRTGAHGRHARTSSRHRTDRRDLRDCHSGVPPCLQASVRPLARAAAAVRVRGACCRPTTGPPQPAAPSCAGDEMTSEIGRLKQLADLKAEGILTHEEMQVRKTAKPRLTRRERHGSQAVRLSAAAIQGCHPPQFTCGVRPRLRAAVTSPTASAVPVVPSSRRSPSTGPGRPG